MKFLDLHTLAFRVLVDRLYIPDPCGRRDSFLPKCESNEEGLPEIYDLSAAKLRHVKVLRGITFSPQSSKLLCGFFFLLFS